MSRAPRRMGTALLAALLIATAILAPSAAAAPATWSYTGVTAGTVATADFPKSYVLPFGFGLTGSVHFKAVCTCGANTITVKIQGTIDGTNYLDESMMKSDAGVVTSMTITGSATLDEVVVLGRADTATVFHPGINYPTYRLILSSSGGTPTLAGVIVQLYAPGRTR